MGNSTISIDISECFDDKTLENLHLSNRESENREYLEFWKIQYMKERKHKLRTKEHMKAEIAELFWKNQEEEIKLKIIAKKKKSNF